VSGAWWSERDPRARLLFALLLTAAALVTPLDRVAWLLLPAGAMAAAALDGPGRRRLVRAVVLLALFTAVANAFLAGGERIGPAWLGPLRPTAEGFLRGAVQGLRLAVLGAAAASLVASTAALDLAASLEWGVRDRPALRRRVHALTFPAVLALGLAGALAAEAARVREVDRLRAGPLRARGPAAVGGLLGAWFAAVVERAERLAAVLTRRGYRPDRPLGFPRPYRFAAGDALLTAAGLACFLPGSLG
jgi:energy-coupling factor transporter transmembrane protein EcfT